MTLGKISPTRIHRRAMLARLGAYWGAGMFPTTAVASSPRSLHIDVAEKARALAGPNTTLSLLIPDGSAANVNPVIAAFTEATGIEIVLTQVPVNEVNAQLILDDLSNDVKYDIALPATSGIPDLAVNNVIRSISNYAEVHEPRMFRSEALYSIGDSFDGELYGFQTDGDVYVMFYHKEWLNDPDEKSRYSDTYDVGLDVPHTWHELDRQMAFFHRPDENRFGGALFRTPSYLAWEWWGRFHAKGVWPLSRDLTPQIASDAGIEALEEMKQATASLYPQSRSADLFENWKHYSQGNTYCNIGWGGTQKYLNSGNSKMRNRMKFGQMPGGEIKGKKVPMPYFNWGWNYVVTAKSRQPELAYLFGLFASTSEISTRSVRAQEGFFDPFKQNHYRDPEIIETYSQEFLAVHEASMSNAIPDLYLANQAEYFLVLSRALDEVVNKGADTKASLERVARQWSVLSLRSGMKQQQDRWLLLRKKYPASVRNFLTDLT